MKWWRSRYVQHLEAENAELRETVKRMLNPQWRYLLYGEQVSDARDAQNSDSRDARAARDANKERVKLPGRRTWSDIRSQVEYLVSPQAVIDQRKAGHQEHIHSVTERIG